MEKTKCKYVREDMEKMLKMRERGDETYGTYSIFASRASGGHGVN
jgi:hypothetical protein